jgi:hypothetical protein
MEAMNLHNALFLLLASAALVQAAPAAAQKTGAPPEELRATATAATVTLRWETPVPPGGGAALAGYRVWRQQGPGSPLEIASLPAWATDHMDDGLAPGTAYTYTVEARYTRGLKPGSASTTVRTAATEASPAASAETAEPGHAVARIPGGTRVPLPSPSSPGAPPTSILAGPTGATAIIVSWNAAPDAAGYDVYRAPTATGPWMRLNASPESEKYFHDRTLAPILTAFYRIHALYPDRADGIGGVVSATTLDQHPGGFTATATDTSTIRLAWQSMPRANRYWIGGVGAVPGGNTMVTGTTHTIRNVPPGTYEYVVIAHFDPVEGFPGEHTTLGRTAPLARVTVGATRGRYRVTITGFTVDRASRDDPWQWDGKGDEVFLAAYVQALNPGEVVHEGAVSSVQYGDVNGFPGRVAAGSANADGSGGLRTDDRVGSWAQGWIRTAPAMVDRLPLAVWEGDLVQGWTVVVIVPTVWEWDKNAWSLQDRWEWSHRSKTRSMAEQPTFGLLAERARLEAQSLYPIVQTQSWNAMPSENGFISEMTVPVGGLPGKTGAGHPMISFQPQSIVLTYDAVEAALGSSSMIGGLAPGVVPVRYDSGTGGYTLYLHVERVQ